MTNIIALVIGGMFAGFTNGLLGTGGGIILIFVLNKIMSKEMPLSMSYHERQEKQKDVFVTTLCVTLVLSLVSVTVYYLKGRFADVTNVWKYTAPAGIGGLLGGILLNKLRIKYIKTVFAVLLIIAGLNMIGVF